MKVHLLAPLALLLQSHADTEVVIDYHFGSSAKLLNADHIGRVLRTEFMLKRIIDANYEGLLEVVHITNGDEEKYGPNSEFPFIGNFHKSLPHYPNGTVHPDAYIYMVNECINKADYDACEQVPGKGILLNPLGGNYIPAAGIPPFASVTAPPPSVDSAELGLQYAELAWMAILRDIPFSEYYTHDLVQKAADSMSSLATLEDVENEFWHRPIGQDGTIDPDTQLFRMDFDGCNVGPMVSQILHKNFIYDGIEVVPKMQTLMPDYESDRMTTFEEFLCIQNGDGSFQQPCYERPKEDPVRRYIRNARDLGELAQSDQITSVYERATKVVDRLIGFRAGAYGSSRRQAGFATHGFARINEQIVAAVAGESHAWFSKWNVHRFLRPEAYGGLVDQRKDPDGTNFPVHNSLLENNVLEEMYDRWESYLLPQIGFGGSPPHPSYPAGHAISAGAAVTILKVYMDPDANKCYPGPIEEASEDGLSLNIVISKEDNKGDGCITVNGELNKLAHNLSMGRDMSGVHWRCDDVAGILQGEEYAITYLQDELDRQPECATLKFKSFAGEFVEITPRNKACAQ